MPHQSRGHQPIWSREAEGSVGIVENQGPQQKVPSFVLVGYIAQSRQACLWGVCVCQMTQEWQGLAEGSWSAQLDVTQHIPSNRSRQSATSLGWFELPGHLQSRAGPASEPCMSAFSSVVDGVEPVPARPELWCSRTQSETQLETPASQDQQRGYLLPSQLFWPWGQSSAPVHDSSAMTTPSHPIT